MDRIELLETLEYNPHLSVVECLKLIWDCQKIVLVKDTTEEVKEFIERLDGVEIEVLK